MAFVLLTHVGQAQSPYFQQITNRDGLPSMTIYDIHEDKKGYIWLATNAGICYYDGVRFTTLDTPLSKGNSFTNLREDSKGRIYFNNFNSQLFYATYTKTGEVTLPSQIRKQDGIVAFFIDAQDHLWLGTKNKRIYLKKNNATVWNSLSLTSPSFCRNFAQDGKGNVWILFNNIFYQISPQLKIKQRVKTPLDFFRVTISGQKAIFNTSAGRHFYSYDIKKKNWTEVFKDYTRQGSNSLTAITNIDRQKNIWICTTAGTKVYSADFKPLANGVTFFKKKFVGRIIQDREGNYWFATIGHGLFKMSNLDILHFNEQNSKLDFEQVHGLAQDDLGNLYLGTNGDQLYYFDTQQQQITQKYPLPNGDVECLFFVKNIHKLYVENGYLYVFDTDTRQKAGLLYTGFTPKAMSLYQGKYLLIATGQGAYMSATDKQQTVPQNYLEAFPKVNDGVLLREKRSRSVCTEATQDRFWVGYADDLYFYENARAYKFKTPDKQSIIALHMSQSADGTVWVATAQKGIFAIKNKKIYLHLDQSTGLISNYCQRVFKEGDELYIGTNKGLQVYNLESKTSRVFNQEDGLPSNEIRDLIVQKDKIYLATTNGLSVIGKDFNTTNYTPPFIYITGFSLKDKPQKLKAKYELAYDENSLVIKFTGIALRSSGKFRYKYRMVGLDPQWIYSNSTSNVARYAALPSGKYQFQVKCVNEDGIESLETATLDVEIDYPIWEKWWFIALMTLLGLTLIIALFFFRIREIQRKNNLEKALGKAALESLKLQMNPHFIFNAMSAIQRYMLKNDARNASHYLTRFSKLMRAVLENSRNEYISLEQEIEMLEGYLTLQNLKHKGSFEYTITVDENLDPEEVAIPPMFAQPFIENAVEHGIHQMPSGGKISIDFVLDGELILLEICDNGIGLTQGKAQKEGEQATHRSLATQITKERIALYQKSLKKNIYFEVKSSAEGTRVLFRMPYQPL
ncbi:hypothetical protein BKI52_43605 [marine bacterium AO1-C]|nr:hypothetical protein BKI52_43605 [marine bacterium AO1-C]